MFFLLLIVEQLFLTKLELEFFWLSLNYFELISCCTYIKYKVKYPVYVSAECVKLSFKF